MSCVTIYLAPGWLSDWWENLAVADVVHADLGVLAWTTQQSDGQPGFTSF